MILDVYLEKNDGFWKKNVINEVILVKFTKFK